MSFYGPVYVRCEIWHGSPRQSEQRWIQVQAKDLEHACDIALGLPGVVEVWSPRYDKPLYTQEQILDQDLKPLTEED